jgi:hypothetical protein
VVECLHSKCKTLNSSPSDAKKEKETKLKLQFESSLSTLYMELRTVRNKLQ